jgi:hypothetical protein
MRPSCDLIHLANPALIKGASTVNRYQSRRSRVLPRENSEVYTMDMGVAPGSLQGHTSPYPVLQLVEYAIRLILTVTTHDP